ncbi:HD domain-containing protein [Actinoplanes sp. NPDC049118]|uniref:HD domain-containing protein n=1 Tax=Actinoplanes sp. NPDC049118 TaxID=3155769 RepID=UPI003407AD83
MPERSALIARSAWSPRKLGCYIAFTRETRHRGYRDDMRAVYTSAGLVHEARHLARILLAQMPERWQHTIGVAGQAEQVIPTVPAADADLLVAVAWLHDIGYAKMLRTSGFHPLDGARYLTAHGCPLRLAALVAHHCEAFLIAEVRGLAEELATYPREQSAVTDALTYADQTISPGGQPMTFQHRLTDMLHRHGPDSPNAAVHPRREPLLRAAVNRVERRLAAARPSAAARHVSP